MFSDFGGSVFRFWSKNNMNSENISLYLSLVSARFLSIIIFELLGFLWPAGSYHSLNIGECGPQVLDVLLLIRHLSLQSLFQGEVAATFKAKSTSRRVL